MDKQNGFDIDHKHTLAFLGLCGSGVHRFSYHLHASLFPVPMDPRIRQCRRVCELRLLSLRIAGKTLRGVWFGV